jgi:transcriptional regulator with XRE-family HTH domain
MKRRWRQLNTPGTEAADRHSDYYSASLGLLGELGTELRDARLGAGISQRHVATVAGLSQATVSRVENARSMATPIDDLASHCAALGLRLSVKVYPDGPAVRDAGNCGYCSASERRCIRAFGGSRRFPSDATAISERGMSDLTDRDPSALTRRQDCTTSRLSNAVARRSGGTAAPTEWCS